MISHNNDIRLPMLQSALCVCVCVCDLGCGLLLCTSAYWFLGLTRGNPDSLAEHSWTTHQIEFPKTSADQSALRQPGEGEEAIII
jgi:hypothetical protein